MTPDDRACLVLDLGGATTSATLLGRVDDHWRLLGNLAAPAATPAAALVATLVARLEAADPALAAEIHTDEAATAWPRLVARTGPPPRLVVVAATERTLGRLARIARRAGWIVVGRSAERFDPIQLSADLLAADTRTVLLGAMDPPPVDERAVIADLGALVAAAAGRRPELTVVLAGGFADSADRFPQPGRDTTPARDTTAAGTGGEDAATGGDDPAAAGGQAAAATAGTTTDAAPVADVSGDASTWGAGALLIAPSPTAGDPPGSALRSMLDDLRARADDGRRGIVRSTTTLAALLERRVETIEIGQFGACRVVAEPLGGSGRTRVRWIDAAEAALVPEVDDALVDRVLGWSTVALDRYRLRDRLSELRLAPWGEAHGDGAPLRLAAARAALERLVALGSDLDRPVPDLTIVSGGVWSIAPGPVVALAVADVVRRSGATQLALDHARLLGPIGTLEDETLRARLLGDLAGDLLTPLGSVVVPAGLRAGRSAGRLVVHAATGTSELDLIPGGLELVDLPPGEEALAEFEFRDTIVLGTRGRRFAVEVGGGLGGLLVDLRDVPLRLPDRPDRRRELLGAWQRALWSGLEP